jgi:hypothetical protein
MRSRSLRVQSVSLYASRSSRNADRSLVVGTLAFRSRVRPVFRYHTAWAEHPFRMAYGCILVLVLPFLRNTVGVFYFYFNAAAGVTTLCSDRYTGPTQVGAPTVFYSSSSSPSL